VRRLLLRSSGIPHRNRARQHCHACPTFFLMSCQEQWKGDSYTQVYAKPCVGVRRIPFVLDIKNGARGAHPALRLWIPGLCCGLLLGPEASCFSTPRSVHWRTARQPLQCLVPKTRLEHEQAPLSGLTTSSQLESHDESLSCVDHSKSLAAYLHLGILRFAVDIHWGRYPEVPELHSQIGLI
jgi:hypothetical protein